MLTFYLRSLLCSCVIFFPVVHFVFTQVPDSQCSGCWLCADGMFLSVTLLWSLCCCIVRLDQLHSLLLHTQLFDGLLSRTTRVSRYQKKHSPTHNHEEEEEGFAQTTMSALSHRGLIDRKKPTYNQSQLHGRLKLAASTCNRRWTMPEVLVTVSTVMQNSLHPLSYSSIIAHSLLNFMVPGKITEADALDATSSGLSMPHLHHPPHFYAECPFTDVTWHVHLYSKIASRVKQWFQYLCLQCFVLGAF